MRRGVLTTVASTACALLLLTSSNTTASADGGHADPSGGAGITESGGTVTAKAEKVHAEPGGSGGVSRTAGTRGRSAVGTSSKQAVTKAQQEIARYLAANRAYQAAVAGCASATTSDHCNPTKPALPASLTDIALLTNPPAGNPSQPPALTPAQIAEIAVAQLTVPTVKAGVGPAPDLNQWHMAVVGYPLWLYADGATHIGPVARTVGTQAVSLDATLSTVTYRMGDGQAKTCTGGGTRWTATVEPGTPSPDCGYTYQKPSLPKGDYTITATAAWAVTWTINGQTGVITISTTSTRQLPVGELQALVR